MDMELHVMLKIFVTLFVLGVMGVFMAVYKALVMEPERTRSILRKQGIGGPQRTFLLGNISEMKKPQSPEANSTAETTLNHNWFGTLFPIFEQWRKQYGNLFMFSLGKTQILYVNQPNLVKEITTYTSLNLGKPSYFRKELGPLFGKGILASNGPTWAHQRKILAPELYMEKVKGMIELILESTDILLNAWKSRIDETESRTADISIDEYLRSFTGDVISRACFGSNYIKGKEIFVELKNLQEVASKKSFFYGVPGTSYFPTKGNKEAWALEKKIHALILEVVKERKKGEYEKDLLQMVLEGAENSELNQAEIDQFIVDNCKNIYLAANEETANAASWCLMLLASNPEWQTRVRTEVLQVCGGQIPDADMLQKMEQLTTVIQETLRLYPPGLALSREALKDIKIGGIDVPKGVGLWTMVATMHTDPEIWGQDALNFNPERFANGITAACKIPHSYLPFGFGPRRCAGQHLAMVELKILIALILSNFSLSLSPKYVHSPTLRGIIKPEHGIDLLVKKL